MTTDIENISSSLPEQPTQPQTWGEWASDNKSMVAGVALGTLTLIGASTGVIDWNEAGWILATTAGLALTPKVVDVASEVLNTQTIEVAEAVQETLHKIDVVDNKGRQWKEVNIPIPKGLTDAEKQLVLDQFILSTLDKVDAEYLEENDKLIFTLGNTIEEDIQVGLETPGKQIELPSIPWEKSDRSKALIEVTRSSNKTTAIAILKGALIDQNGIIYKNHSKNGTVLNYCFFNAPMAILYSIPEAKVTLETEHEELRKQKNHKTKNLFPFFKAITPDVPQGEDQPLRNGDAFEFLQNVIDKTPELKKLLPQKQLNDIGLPGYYLHPDENNQNLEALIRNSERSLAQDSPQILPIRIGRAYNKEAIQIELQESMYVNGTEYELQGFTGYSGDGKSGHYWSYYKENGKYWVMDDCLYKDSGGRQEITQDQFVELAKYSDTLIYLKK